MGPMIVQPNPHIDPALPPRLRHLFRRPIFLVHPLEVDGLKPAISGRFEVAQVRGDEGALLRAQAQVLGGAVVDERTGLIGPKVLRGQQVRDGKLGVGGEVAEQADVAVGEGAEDEGAAKVVQREAAIAPGFEVVPDPANRIELVGVPEAGEVVVGQQTDEGVVVVLVDGLEGVFALRAGGERGGVGFGKDLIGVAPFLGEVGPGDGGGE